jgi:hypothetical protein
VPDIPRKLRNVRKVPLLAGVPRLCLLVKNESQRFVISEHSEPLPLQHIAEVTNPAVDGEKLPINGAVAGLRSRQLMREKAKRPLRRRTVLSLLQDRFHVCLGGVHHQAEVHRAVRMYQG